MSTLEVNTIAPITGSSDVTLGGSSKNIKFASGTTVDFSTNTPTLTLGSGMKATPSFEAFQSANTDISDAVTTKVQCNTEVFDTDGCYDNSTNYRFTPTVAGKYFFYGAVQGYGGQVAGIEALDVHFYKNGSVVRRFSHNYNNNLSYVQHSNFHIIVDMNGSSDYVELYVNFNSAGTPRLNGDSSNGDHCYWGGYRLIGV